MNFRKISYIITFLVIIVNSGCNSQNHIDKYEVNIESLKILPDGFYAFRRGNIYFTNSQKPQYTIWINLDYNGKVEKIYNVIDVKNNEVDKKILINKYKIDTVKLKINMQKFIELSQKYKFGHIYMERKNKISFSYQNGLTEEYVRPLNDSINGIYLKNPDFTLLKNGWFENKNK